MDGKRDGDRDRGRKLKWSQWCGIVVRLVVRRSMRLVRRPCVTSVSLAFSLRFTCLFRYSSVFLSLRRTRRSDLPVSTRAYPCVSLPSHDSRDGDVTSSTREEKFREGRKSERGRWRAIVVKENFFPPFNSASLGSWTPKFFLSRRSNLCLCIRCSQVATEAHVYCVSSSSRY